ncbi:hypothetical protein AJ80_05599 [Polytolypa hystricis UAMH7299]|uniref:Uncharacterized protein n=1 Tax=Polytolypa hystricis (strain UAMH7299) TaxID=1447883 RepID=A0A2B7Y1A7_POLH7|nr:hypothetical protein AJ80_05599 [Polytolypa hystricis UAMH7299]
MPSLDLLPTELLLMIIDCLDAERDINVLVRTNKLLYLRLNWHLYRHNARKGNGEVLLWAVNYARISTIRHLLAAGAKPRAVYSRLSIKAPLIHWVVHGMCGSGATRIMPLRRAAKRRSVPGTGSLAARNAVLRVLLQYGADINERDSNWYSILHHAAESGQETLFRLLVGYGADIHAKSFEGHSVLHSAANAGCTGIIRFLVNRGLDVNAYIGYGKPILHYAVRNRSTAMIHLLIRSGADPNARNSMDWTAIDTVIFGSSWPAKQRLTTLRALIDNGADINARNSRGETLLHRLAAMNDSFLLVPELISLRADIEAQCNQGWTVLQRAIAAGSLEMFHVLLENGVDVNSFRGRGETPMHTAVAFGDKPEFIEGLYEKGANLYAKDWQGRDALMRAHNRRQSDPDTGYVFTTLILDLRIREWNRVERLRNRELRRLRTADFKRAVWGLNGVPIHESDTGSEDS